MIRLQRYMSETGISQAELARRVGVKQPTVWGWINGRSAPSAKTLVVLSRQTGISIDELLRDSAR